MSPLARVAGLAAIAAGAVVAAAGPAVAAPVTPNTPSTQEASPAGQTPSEEQSPQEGATTGQTPSEEQSAQEGTTASPSAHGTPSAQDSQFLQQSHQTNLAEISAGHLAQQKGKSQTVKNLGAKFVTDHTKLDQSLQSVANSLGVSLPSTPNSDQQAVMNRLKNKSGTQFDNLFVTSQFAGHTVAMQQTQTEITNGSDPQAVKLANQALPVIESHHQALQAAAKQLGITLPTASPTAPTASPTTPTTTTTESPTAQETATPSNTNS